MNANYVSIMEKVQSQEILVLDTRVNHEFLDAHIPGSVNAPYNSYGWARSISSWLDGQKIDIVLVSDGRDSADRITKELGSVGLSILQVISDALGEWRESGMPLSSVGEITPDELYSHFDRWTILDVREPYEWQTGTLKNSIRIPLNDLPSRLSEFTTSDRYAVICAHGNRSEIAALFLADNGLHASTVVGGLNEWLREQLPVEFEQ